jgi:hypothetical protein
MVSRCIANFLYGCNEKKAMATPRMNDPTWVDSLARAKACNKYEFVCIHVLAPFRDNEGVAPVVLQTTDGYLRAPAHMEAAFELCLRHLHRKRAPGPDKERVTAQALLANRAVEALKLPGMYVPTVEGKVIDLEPTGQTDCEALNRDATAMMADHNDTEQSTKTPTETMGDLDDGAEHCVEEITGSMHPPTTIATLPDADAEQRVEPPATRMGQASSEMNQALEEEEEELGRTQLATTTAALDPSDTEAQPIAGETPGSTEVDTASVETQPSTLSKKARRRAAMKARRRGT